MLLRSRTFSLLMQACAWSKKCIKKLKISFCANTLYQSPAGVHSHRSNQRVYLSLSAARLAKTSNLVNAANFLCASDGHPTPKSGQGVFMLSSHAGSPMNFFFFFFVRSSFRKSNKHPLKTKSAIKYTCIDLYMITQRSTFTWSTTATKPLKATVRDINLFHISRFSIYAPSTPPLPLSPDPFLETIALYAQLIIESHMADPLSIDDAL